METTQSLVEKVNQKIGEKCLYYVTVDPEKAIGLEKLIKNFKIVTYPDYPLNKYLLNNGIEIIFAEKSDKKSSYRLIKDQKIFQLFQQQKNKNNFVMFFKISPSLEKISKTLNLHLLNTSSELNRKFEFKLPQLDFFKGLPIKIPDSFKDQFKNLDFCKIVNQLDLPFIVQFNRGHTGDGTIIIDSEEKFNELKEKFNDRSAKFSKFIKGKSYTINCCATKKGTFIGGLSYQLTGIDQCTSKKGSTVGNDWFFPSFLNSKTKEKIANFAKIIGDSMLSSGFKGLFGIDLIIDSFDNVFVIEINARQIASIPMHTKLQLKRGEIPLSLISLAEFLDIDFDINCNSYNFLAMRPYNAAQVFLRNLHPCRAKIIGDVKTGIYNLRGDNSTFDWKNMKQKENVIFLTEDKDISLIFENEAYCIDQINQAGVLILSQPEGKIVEPNAEIARFQILQTVVDSNGDLLYWAKKICEGLNQYIVTRKQ